MRLADNRRQVIRAWRRLPRAPLSAYTTEVCPRAGKLRGCIGVSCENCGGIWAKIDHIPPHFSAPRCSFPAVFRLPAPSSVRRCFARQNPDRIGFCRITHATATTLPSRPSNVGNRPANVGQRRPKPPRPTSAIISLCPWEGIGRALSIRGSARDQPGCCKSWERN